MLHGLQLMAPNYTSSIKPVLPFSNELSQIGKYYFYEHLPDCPFVCLLVSKITQLLVGSL